MKTIKRWLQGRRWLRSRRTGQGFIEFSLIAVSITIIGVAGLTVLSHAEEGYFIPLQHDMALPVPVGTDDVVHPTQTTTNCPPPVPIPLEGSTLTCVATVTDHVSAPFTPAWPQGSITWTFDGVQTSCGLNPAGTDRSVSCPFNHLWSHAELSSSHTLSAQYVPTSKHAAGAPWGPVTYTLNPVYDFAFNAPAPPSQPCVNPWHGYPQLEVGHPLECVLTVSDHFDNTQVFPGVSIDVSSTPPSGSNGDPTFACFSGDNYLVASGCTRPTPTMTCTTDGAGQCHFIYRRAYDPTKGGVINDALVATATAVSQSSAPLPVTLRDPDESFTTMSGHPTGTFVECSHPNPSWSFDDDPAHAARVQDLVVNTSNNRTGQNWVIVKFETANKIWHHGAGQVTCTAIVFDGDPHPIFDANPPGAAGCGSDALKCNPDTAMAHPPMGQVVFQDLADTTTYGACLVGHSGARPNSLSNPVTTAPPTVPIDWTFGHYSEFASWCSWTLNSGGGFPPLPTTVTLHVNYLQETSFGPVAAPAHAISTSPPIDVNFN